MRQIRHRRIDVDEGSRFKRGIFQHFPHGETVAAAKHEHPLRAWTQRIRRMHEGFVVTVFVRGRELEVPVEEQLKPRTVSRDHEALVRRGLRVDDLVRVHLLLAVLHDGVGPGENANEEREDCKCPETQPLKATRGNGIGEEVRAPERDARVEESEDDGRAHEPKLRHAQKREEQRGREAPEIVEREDARDEVAELHAPLKDAHQ